MRQQFSGFPLTVDQRDEAGQFPRMKLLSKEEYGPAPDQNNRPGDRLYAPA